MKTMFCPPGASRALLPAASIIAHPLADQAQTAYRSFGAAPS